MPQAAPQTPDIGAILAGSLTERWLKFQAQLRRTRRASTEPSVHDLRVSMRRLIATIDMVNTVIPDGGLQKARRSLRKHLKRFNRLRDTHIQILTLRSLAREFPPVRPLGVELRRREARLIREARGTIASINPMRLGQSLAEASVRLGSLMRLPGMQHVGVTTVLGALGAAFARAFELRRQVNPSDPTSIHRLRVAFKKCRYMIEVLRPILPGVDKRYLKSLNAFQTRMGNIQDARVVTACVDGFTLNSRYAPALSLSLVPVQQRLAEMQTERIEEFLAAADELYDLWKTAGVAAPAPASGKAQASDIPGPARRAPAGVARRSSPASGATRRQDSARGGPRRRPARSRRRSPRIRGHAH